MSHESEAADLLMRQSLNIGETAVKLTALGAKNLAALVLALAKDNQKLKGKTKLTQLLTEGKELKVLPLRTADLKQFQTEAERYGVLFSTIKNSRDAQGNLDILFRAEDISKVTRILERMGYGKAASEQAETWQEDVPEQDVTQEQADAKNGQPRAPQRNKSAEHGSGLPASRTDTSEVKPSVRQNIDQIKDAQEGRREALRARAAAMRAVSKQLGSTGEPHPER